MKLIIRYSKKRGWHLFDPAHSKGCDFYNAGCMSLNVESLECWPHHWIPCQIFMSGPFANKGG